MKSLLIAVSLASTIAMAETGTFTVKGMHCSGCKETVTKKVCEGEAAKDAESCTVKITNAKKEMGEVVIVTKPGVKINADAVTAGVKAAGDEYKVTNVQIKEMIAQDLKEDATTTAGAEAKPETVTTTTTVETKSTGADGKPVVKVEKTKKIVKKMAKKDGAAKAKQAAPTAAVTPAETAAPTAPTTPETK